MTGTEEINDNLGVARSQYIAEYLTANGVPAENITSHSEGGIDTYTPNPANRNATVRLYLP
jgi:outer membrane protein OmpA-like peptidoglycan-associated protein